MLHQLSTGPELTMDMTPTRRLRFSPNGKLLATYGTDQTVQIWSVNDNSLSATHMLWHKSFAVHQVACQWGPLGDVLVIKQPKLIQVWDPNVRRKRQSVYSSRFNASCSVEWHAPQRHLPVLSCAGGYLGVPIPYLKYHLYRMANGH